MDSNTREILYQELMTLQQSLEDGDIRGVKNELENLINKMKPDYIDSTFLDLQRDLVTYLTERLNKFNPRENRSSSNHPTTSSTSCHCSCNETCRILAKFSINNSRSSFETL